MGVIVKFEAILAISLLSIFGSNSFFLTENSTDTYMSKEEREMLKWVVCLVVSLNFALFQTILSYQVLDALFPKLIKPYDLNVYTDIGAIVMMWSYLCTLNLKICIRFSCSCFLFLQARGNGYVLPWLLRLHGQFILYF